MDTRTTTPERISLGVGLCAVMLATLPRYLAGGHDTRTLLVLMGVAAIALVMVIQWRLLPAEGKQRLPRMVVRLAGLLVLGSLLFLGWYALQGASPGWRVWLSHGTTLGLLVHAVTLWRR